MLVEHGVCPPVSRTPLIRSCFTVRLGADSDGNLGWPARSDLGTVARHVLLLPHSFFSRELALSCFITARGIHPVMHCPWATAASPWEFSWAPRLQSHIQERALCKGPHLSQESSGHSMGSSVGIRGKGEDEPTLTRLGPIPI